MALLTRFTNPEVEKWHNFSKFPPKFATITLNMGLVVLEKELTKKDIESAREHYELYIKITADVDRGIVIIGGEYHADAEKMLIEKYISLQKDIWGGGYNLRNGKFETNAIINLRSGTNESMDILDQKIRDRFLALIQDKLKNIKDLL